MDSPATDNAKTSDENSKNKDDIIILNVEGYEGYEDESIIILRTRNQNYSDAIDTVKAASQYAKQPVKYDEKQSGLEIEKRIHVMTMQGYENIPDGLYLLFRMKEKSNVNNGDDNSQTIAKEEDPQDHDENPTSSTEIQSTNVSEDDEKITYQSFIDLLKSPETPSTFTFYEIKEYLRAKDVIINSKQLNSFLYRATEKNILEKSPGVYKHYKLKI